LQKLDNVCGQGLVLKLGVEAGAWCKLEDKNIKINL
jgi:hypothetical protein